MRQFFLTARSHSTSTISGSTGFLIWKNVTFYDVICLQPKLITIKVTKKQKILKEKLQNWQKTILKILYKNDIILIIYNNCFINMCLFISQPTIMAKRDLSFRKKKINVDYRNENMTKMVHSQFYANLFWSIIFAGLIFLFLIFLDSYDLISIF